MATLDQIIEEVVTLLLQVMTTMPLVIMMMATTKTLMTPLTTCPSTNNNNSPPLALHSTPKNHSPTPPSLYPRNNNSSINFAPQLKSLNHHVSNHSHGHHYFEVKIPLLPIRLGQVKHWPTYYHYCKSYIRTMLK